jgi:hypothetical protein
LKDVDYIIDRCDVDNWSRDEFKYSELDHGKWELVIPPNKDGTCRIQHNSVLKVSFGLGSTIRVTE